MSINKEKKEIKYNPKELSFNHQITCRVRWLSIDSENFPFIEDLDGRNNGARFSLSADGKVEIVLLDDAISYKIRLECQRFYFVIVSLKRVFYLSFTIVFDYYKE